MPKYFFLSFFIFLVQAATSQLLIKNTNVIDVENNKILTGYDVLVEKGRITSVVKTTPASRDPMATQVIDGGGKYLIPGLADAHVHFFQTGGLFTRPDAIDLRKYQPYDKGLNWRMITWKIFFVSTPAPE